MLPRARPIFRRDVVMVDCDTPPATRQLGLVRSTSAGVVRQHIPLNGSSAPALAPASGIAQSAARRTPSRRAHGKHTRAEHFERSPDYRQLGCGAAALGPEAALSHLGGQPSAGPDASRREPATRRAAPRAAMADQETKEFDTNVADADERKRIRAQRIEARRDAEKGALDKANEERKAAERSQGKQQIAESLSHLDKKKSAGIEKVTDVRVAADWREAQRRVAEEKKRQDRLQRLQEEAVSSGKQNAIIEARWAELVEQNIPRELHDAIEVQKEACAEILRSKDELIKEFRQELKKKDEEYVKALKQQKEDINQLLERMRQEFKELQGEYEVELEAIEDAFLAERDELLNKNREEIDALYEKRKEAELKFLENRRAREEKHRQEIEDMLVKDGEEYNKLKIKLENAVQTLERQLEEMRATYQLNTEKLDYIYRVLTERDSENSTTLQQLKRKQNKLKDVLSRVMAKYQETDERDKNENERLTEEYKRMTKAYRDLQLKFRHFEVTDRQKFDRVWQMCGGGVRYWPSLRRRGVSESARSRRRRRRESVSPPRAVVESVASTACRWGRCTLEVRLVIRRRRGGESTAREHRIKTRGSRRNTQARGRGQRTSRQGPAGRRAHPQATVRLGLEAAGPRSSTSSSKAGRGDAGPRGSAGAEAPRGGGGGAAEGLRCEAQGLSRTSERGGRLPRREESARRSR